VVVPGVKYALVNNSNFEFYVGAQYWKPVGNFTGYHNGVVTYEAAAFHYRAFRSPQEFPVQERLSAGQQRRGDWRIEWSHNITKNWAIAPGVDWARARAATAILPPV